MLTALSNEVPNSRHFIKFETYANHFGPMVGARTVAEFKQSISSKKWKTRFKEAVGESGCLEHSDAVFVRGSECTYDPQRLFLFKNQVKRDKYSISTIIRWQKKKKGANDLQRHVNIASEISEKFSCDIVDIRKRQNSIPKLVDTILELAGARVIDLEIDIGISEQEGISPIEVSWPKNLSKEGSCNGAAEHASPQGKRTRSSTTPMSLSGPLEDNSKLTYAAPELPEAFRTLNDLSILALMELVLHSHGDLRGCGDNEEAASKLLKIIKEKWSTSTLVFPLPTKYSRPKGHVTMPDVMSLFNMTRRRYVHGGVTMDNTNAERKKKHLEAQVDAAREKHRADLAKNQQPQVVLAINMHFSSRKLLVECFPQLPAVSMAMELEEEEQQEEQEGEVSTRFFLSWLRSRQAKWRKKYQKPDEEREKQAIEEKRKKREEERAPTELPDLHPIVPWKVIHGLNKQLYLPDEKAAQIRHMMVECKIAERNIPALIGMAYAFFTDMPMPPAMAVSQEVISMSMQRLDERDCKDVAEYIARLIQTHPHALITVLTDDTNFKDDRHQINIAMWNMEVCRPGYWFVSARNATMKLSSSNATDNQIALASLGVPPKNDGGGTGDRPGLVEFGSKPKIPDEWHTHALHHKHFR